MSFIRAKEIPPGSGNWYDYEVKSVWKNGTCRQEHIRYVGRSGRAGIGFSGSTGAMQSPVKPDSLPDIDYKVKLYQRPTAKKKPVIDAALTPIISSENKK